MLEFIGSSWEERSRQNCVLGTNRPRSRVGIVLPHVLSLGIKTFQFGVGVVYAKLPVNSSLLFVRFLRLRPRFRSAVPSTLRPADRRGAEGSGSSTRIRPRSANCRASACNRKRSVAHSHALAPVRTPRKTRPSCACSDCRTPASPSRSPRNGRPAVGPLERLVW
jgi:hypothetical protein